MQNGLMVKGYGEIISGQADLSTFGVAVPDESTFQVTLTYDCPYFLEICAFAATFPVRKDIIEAYGDTWTTEDHSAYYISNGPYKLEEWVHDSYITLVPNQFYYDVDNLGPDSITFQLMADQNSMLAGYRAESLHFIRDVPVDETITLLASGELDIVEYIRTYYALYQTEKAPFDDWRVRKAFTLVINSPYIVEYITQSGEVPAAGFVPL